MKLIKINPTSNGVRHVLKLQKNLLCKNNKLIKNLLLGSKNWAGRNSITGVITIRHRGTGCKKLFRAINFTNLSFFALVLGITYDPNRSVFISLNYNLKENSFFYTPATNKVTTGSLIICQEYATELRLGYRLTLKSIPVGTFIHNIALSIKNKTQYIRSAGTYGQLQQKTINNCKVKLPSGIIINLLPKSYATIGILTNLNNNKRILGKAGYNRLKGFRPSVRGIAMNPVDHPHGGRSNGGCHPMTPWGKPARGKSTRKK